MANKIRNLHRLAGGGGAGSPGAVAESGVVALNFDVGAGTPELWASDGAAWKRLNPASALNYATGAEVITGTDAVKVLSPASLAAAGVVVSGGAADAAKYPRLDAAGLLDDTLIPKSTAAEIIAGTAADKFITPAGLAAAATDSSAGAADAGKILLLDATGKIDSSMLPIDAMEFQGGVDVTGAAPAAPEKGDVWVVTTGGVAAAGFTGIAGQTVGVGDQLIFDGTNFVRVVGTDTTAYIPIAGTAGIAGAALTSGAVITFNPAASGNVVLNGATGTNFGAIDKCVVDCGVF